MSYEPPGFTKNSIYSHGKVYESTTKVGSLFTSSEKPVANGAARFLSRHDEGKHRRNYKLLIDPALKKGSEKIFRFDGEFPGQPPIVPKDPRSRRTRIWTLNKADLPVPNFKFDKYYVGMPPQREVVFTGLNDNVDKKFLQEMCQKYGKVEHIKIYYDPLTKKHTGKAKVTFDLTKSAKLACNKLNSCSVMGNIITTQLEPNLKGINARLKCQKSLEKSNSKDATFLQYSSKPPIHYPTPPQTNSHSPSMESVISTPSTPKSARPVDPRIRNTTPRTPPTLDGSCSGSGAGFQNSFGSQLSGHGTLYSSSLSSSTNSFEPISPPPVLHKDSTPVVQDTPLEGAPPLPPPADKNSSFLNYEDISPEQPPTPDTGKTTKESTSQPSIKSSSVRVQGDESKITKMVESARKDSGRHNRSPKSDKYTQECRSHDQRHDDKRDKHRDRYGDYFHSRDYQDDKDYGSRRDNKRGDRYSEHRSGYSRQHDSWKDPSYSDYKSRSSRTSYRDDHDKRYTDKYKRGDRYSTSPRRPEDRDRYSPHRNDDRRKPELTDSHGKEDLKSRDRHGRKSPIESSSDLRPYGSSREEKRCTATVKGSRSQSPVKAGKSPIAFHARKGPVSPPGSPGDASHISNKHEGNAKGLDETSHDSHLSGSEQDKSRTKQLGQDGVRKRKLSNSTDGIEESKVKSKKTNCDMDQSSEPNNEHDRYSPEMFEDTKNSCRGEESVSKEDSKNDNKSNEVTSLPQVEDISPCPSPLETVTVNVAVKSSEDPISLYSDIEGNDDVDNVDDKNEQQDDDAMSLSSISSNEDTFELNEPSKKIAPQPQPVTVPPPNMVFSFPPPMMPPPPPLMFNPHIPPPLPFPPPHLPPPPPGAIPPPHILPPTIPGTSMPPLPPPIPPPPNMLPPIMPGNATPFSSSYQHPGFRTQGFEYKPSKQEKYWNWKRQIIEVVSNTLHNELDSVLSRDVLRKLVELSAFKSLDAWWENQKKPKPMPSSSTTVHHPATVGQVTSTSSTLLGPSPFDRSHGIAASLPKLPSFRRRAPEIKQDIKTIESLDKAAISDKSGESSHGVPKKRRMYDSESEHDAEVEGLKRQRTVSNLIDDTDDDRSQSPWQHLDDNMEAAPPATDVRAAKAIDRRTGSSLYKTIYSSESEEEESEAESEDKDESDDQDEEDFESEEEESSEEDSEEEESEGSEDEDEEHDEQEELTELKGGIGVAATTTDNAVESDIEIDKTSDDISIKSTVETVTLSQTTNFDTSLALPLLSDTTKPAVHNENDISAGGELVHPDKKTVDEQLVEDKKKLDGIITYAKPLDDTLDQEVQQFTELHEKHRSDVQSIASVIELDHSYGLAPRDEVSPPIDVVSIQILEKDLVDSEIESKVKLDLVIKEKPKPKPLFPLRSFEQDDELVYEFLKSGLEYEDAYYLKVGFDQLTQMCSQSVVAAKWSFHPVTAQPVNTPTPKRRRQKADVGISQHVTGCARSEGYYKIDNKEKARYAENAHKQVQQEESVTVIEEPKLDASKGKQLSRENRAMQRRLQSAVCNEDFGDILKFNKLRVRKKQLKFAKSSIHDWGLVALEPIAADEMVIEYVGEMIRQIIADTRERSYEERGIGSSYLFRLDEETIIDATIKGNFARFINHCCEPNCYAKVIAMENEKKIVIYSKRDIQVNEEITYDYKFPLEDEKIPCLCGATHCRGTLN